MRFESLTSQLRNEFDESKLPDFHLSYRISNNVPSDLDFKAIADALDCHRDFYGAGIIYSDGLYERYLVRPSKRRGNPAVSELTHIIIFNLEAGAVPEVELKKTVSEPNLALEIGSTALACGAAAAYLATTVGSGAATPLTGGTSTILSGLAFSGFLASGAQCLNGTYRVVDLTFGGDDGAERIAWLDSQDWYTTTSTMLDFISLASGTAALKETYQTYKIMRSTSPRKASEWLNNMPRHEKKRLTEEIIRYYNPGISNQEIKRLIALGQYPKRYPTEQIRNALKNNLINTLSSGGAFISSGMTGIIKNPENVFTSGKYVIGVIHSFAAENPAGYRPN
ncbi:hypothetical protein Xmau_01582 [Xenorhabdus mauleonii]|uniref:Uncharacterized protein n=1 Tax=Xenorhabdus mauleonii TaxID=351675 RepID=A0A1I3PBH1_9GAMM|nr:hypothetical protein [Xenorhabdus mauleonii]PHM44868.1 hypothetical protein Xmau_01582 [Xenorhabdus mauleonii]SFJ18396.1 hypothetical protein SAMN05421680_10679 [Xenorhabdus mauleonii]